MLIELKERLAKFKLALHERKTRLIDFGRLSTELRAQRGAGRCETFNFLGFTHYCARSLDGRFVVKRHTDRRRLMRKLRELREEARRRLHAPVGVRDWLASVLRGDLRVLRTAEQLAPA
jgi:RNA-directed DNA polymerase